MAQIENKTAQTIYGEEIFNTLERWVRNMFSGAAVGDEQLESLIEEYKQYIFDDEKLYNLLEMYALNESSNRQVLANTLAKMFLMEKVFGKKK